MREAAEAVGWCALYSAAVLAPIAIIIATSDAAVRRRALRQWQDEERERRERAK